MRLRRERQSGKDVKKIKFQLTSLDRKAELA
jgi:hypothetical protein